MNAFCEAENDEQLHGMFIYRNPRVDNTQTYWTDLHLINSDVVGKALKTLQEIKQINGKKWINETNKLPSQNSQQIFFMVMRL